MPEIKLGTDSRDWPKVIGALEETAGLPRSTGSFDRQWLAQVVEPINKGNETDIKYSSENHGYWFEYSTPKSAMLLGTIKQKYGL